MKITTLHLTDSERHNLETAYQMGDSHCYRTRCKAILLKSQGKAASEIASFLDVSVPSVYSWIKRYKADGVKGLETKTGSGRKPIINSSDEEIIRKAIEEDRQSVSKARDAWQNATGKEASYATLKCFLSVLVQDISE